MTKAQTSAAPFIVVVDQALPAWLAPVPLHVALAISARLDRERAQRQRKRASTGRAARKRSWDAARRRAVERAALGPPAPPRGRPPAGVSARSRAA